MRVKLTIFILSSFLLWGSLLSGSYHTHHSKCQEINIAGEFTCKALLEREDVTFKKAHSPSTNFHLNFTTAAAYLSLEPVKSISNFTKHAVKYYLLFKVLRN